MTDLRQATDSALRGVIGKYTMDRILTEGRTVIRSDTQRELEETMPFRMTWVSRCWTSTSRLLVRRKK